MTVRLSLACGLVVASVVTSAAQTVRLSVATDGTQANLRSFEPFISTDGRVVAFTSEASNLVAGDTNGSADVFVHHRSTRQIVRVSVSTGGAQANQSSHSVAINADGSAVAFTSNATNLVSNDGNGFSDVFVWTAAGTSRVSTPASGGDANGASGQPQISGTGTYVAFASSASNLIAGDSNSASDIFIRDLSTGGVTRVSVATGGQQANGGSDSPGISADGTVVVFRSDASNLVPNDTNGLSDIFVHDRSTGVTTLVSVSTGGAQANGGSYDPVISGDGRVVSYVGYASNLVGGDTNGTGDVFVHEIPTSQTSRVSVGNDGQQGNNQSECPSLSADGRFVVFDSTASNLVFGDSNAVVDVFLRDRVTGETILLSVSNDGTPGNGMSSYPDVSGDGTIVVFDSFASNLVTDTNGAQDVFERVPTLTTAVPGAPSNLSFQLQGADVNLNWSAPNDGGPVGTYVLFVSTSGESFAPFVLNSTATSFRAASVPPGTYYVRVSAQNRLGVGASSNTLYIGPPSAPRNFVADVRGNTVTMNWMTPLSAVPVDAYVVSAATPSGRVDVVTGSTATSFTVGNVPVGTYFAVVSARNHFGPGQPSNVATIVVRPDGCADPPQAPAGLMLTMSGNMATLNWNASPGCPATSYIVEAGSVPGGTDIVRVDVGNVMSISATLAQEVSLYARVRARNANGISAPSNEVRVIWP